MRCSALIHTILALLLLHAHLYENRSCFKASNAIAVTEFELKFFASCTLMTQDLRLAKRDAMLCGHQRGISWAASCYESGSLTSYQEHRYIWMHTENGRSNLRRIHFYDSGG